MIEKKPRALVLFDGAGLARLGLTRAGFECVGVEIDPVKHWLSERLCPGEVILADVRDINLTGFDAVWASPPCQAHSEARTQAAPTGLYSEDLLYWSLTIKSPILWVENVPGSLAAIPNWGRVYNAAQFDPARQSRQRVIGGRHPEPLTDRPFRRGYEDIPPAIVASEWKGCATDPRRASRFFGRKITLAEAAYHQGIARVCQPGTLSKIRR